MAEKILALLAAFVLGVVVAMMLGSKMVNLGLRHSPRLRAMVRAQLDRHDKVKTDAFSQELVEAGLNERLQLCAAVKVYTSPSGAQYLVDCPNTTVLREPLCVEHKHPMETPPHTQAPGSPKDDA